MTQDTDRLPDRWEELERQWRGAFQGLTLDAYDETLHFDGAFVDVPVSSPREHVEAWQRFVAAGSIVMFVDSRSSIDPRSRWAVVTSSPLATHRYAIPPPMDEHCRAFEVEVTTTTAGAVDIEATVAGPQPTRGALVALSAELGLAIELLPNRLRVRESR